MTISKWSINMNGLSETETKQNFQTKIKINQQKCIKKQQQKMPKGVQFFLYSNNSGIYQILLLWSGSCCSAVRVKRTNS